MAMLSSFTKELRGNGDVPAGAALYHANAGLRTLMEPSANLLDNESGKDALVEMITDTLRVGKPDYFAWHMTSWVVTVEPSEEVKQRVTQVLEKGEMVRRSDVGEGDLSKHPDKMETVSLVAVERGGALQLWGANLWRVNGESPFLDKWERKDIDEKGNPGRPSGRFVDPFIEAMTP